MQVIDANIAKQPLDTESTHIMTVRLHTIKVIPKLKLSQGVDKLHAEGVTGKGIKIGMWVF